MDELRFSKQITIVRTVVGAVLALASLVFLWKGVAGTGEIGMDFRFFSGKFSTTSAGIALLFAGVLLLLPHRPSPAAQTVEQRSIGQLAIGVIFYVFIGLLPVLACVGVMIYLHYNRPDALENLFTLFVTWTIMIEVPLLIWVVGQVSRLLQAGGKT
jgi:tetrahydromethanopterin S-methyltransferase subunit F